MQKTELREKKLTLPFPEEPSTTFSTEMTLWPLNCLEFHQKEKKKKRRKKYDKLYQIFSESGVIVNCLSYKMF